MACSIPFTNETVHEIPHLFSTAVALLFLVDTMSTTLLTGELRGQLASTNAKFALIPQMMQGVKVRAQLRVAIIRMVSRRSILGPSLLGDGPPLIGCLCWVLPGKTALDSIAGSPDVVKHVGKPLLPPHLHHLELVIHMCVKDSD